MEFKFSVNEIFRQPFVKIGNNMVPPGFTGDRRAFWDAVGKVSEVVNAMGEASAAAQGLTKPITTSDRLRNSEHTIYLLIDQNANNGRGAVTGMLKTGKKGLYVFDRNGQHYQVSPPCVLDFYIHESRQRTGLGKRLFEHMLQEENIEPVKMAIDRPSDKFLGFLNKYYSLNNPVKQMNNYVVFDGFFPSSPEKNGAVEVDHSGSTPGKKQSANGLQSATFASPLGRYGAPRPPCSMGQIIHNQTSTIPKSTEPTGLGGVRSAPETNYRNAPMYSPGIPSNVTQSAPNIYYGSPENPEAKLNGLPEFYHTNQQKNVCQNYGNAGSVDAVNYQNYYNQQNYAAVEQQQQLLPNQQNIQQTHYYNQLQEQQFAQNRVTPHEQPQYITPQSAHPNAVYAANLNQNQNMVANAYNTQENYVPQMTQSLIIPPQDIPTNQAQGMQHVQYPQQPIPAQNTLPQASPGYAQYTQAAQLTNQQVQSQNTVSQANLGHTQYTQATQPANQQILAQSNVGQASARYTQYAQAAHLTDQQQVTTQSAVAQANPGYTQYTQATQPTNQQIPTQNTVSQASPTYTQYPQAAQSVHPQEVTVQITPNVTSPRMQHAYQQQISAGAAQNTISQGQIPPNVAPSAYYTQSRPQLTQFAPSENINQPQVLQNTPGGNMHHPQATSQEQYTYNTSTGYQYAAGNAEPPTPQYPANNMQMTQAAANVNMQYPTNYTPSMLNTNVDNSQMVQMTAPASQPNVPAANLTPRNQTQNIHKTLSQPNAGYDTSNSQTHPSNMQYQSQPQTNVNPSSPRGVQQTDGLHNKVTNATGRVPDAKGETQVTEEKVTSSPKLERPRSLSIQLSEEQTEEKKVDDVESEVPRQETYIEEDIIEKLTISENGAEVAHSVDKVPTPENKTPGKRTPSHLTEQGFFDLKFYHNKLW